jgi:tubulin-folding cofactor B
MADITVHVTSSLTNSERRVSPNWSLKHLKQRLETITGIPPADQQLLLFPSTVSTQSTTIRAPAGDENDEDSVTLAALNIAQASRIHVNETRPISEQTDWQDDANTEFFELNDEEYDKRSGTVRQWKRDNQLGRFDPGYESRKQEQLKLNHHKSDSIPLGSRFRTIDDINGERRGVVRYVGKVPVIDHENVWVGVEFDEPVGKNDGSLKGERYFTTQRNRGGFLKPVQVETGDYPELDLFSDDDEL